MYVMVCAPPNMYVMMCIRPDILQVVNIVGRFMANPTKEEWKAVKWTLRYLKGIIETILCFGGETYKLNGYVNLIMLVKWG